MNRLHHLLRATRGAAAVEMALVTPLLLIIMMGSMELGNYFLDEHALVKGVRDGARYAARQGFSNYTCPSGTVPGGTVVADTQNVVRTGVVSGGTSRLAGQTNAMITVTMSCKSDLANGSATPPAGIYRNSSGATPYAPVVIVSATVPYTPVMKSFGFRGVGMNLNANQQAAVMGI